MLKPLVFTSLYALAGISGWGAYSVIDEQDTSINTLATLAKTTNEKIINSIHKNDKHVYRYKNEDNEWVYSDKPLDPNVSNSYKKELEFLQSLPQEAMPTNAFKTIPQATNLIQQVASGETNVSKLMAEAKRVAKMLEDHNELLDDVLHNRDPDK